LFQSYLSRVMFSEFPSLKKRGRGDFTMIPDMIY
jgi:hypothetical protein